jgi:hypothetical protein
LSRPGGAGTRGQGPAEHRLGGIRRFRGRADAPLHGSGAARRPRSSHSIRTPTPSGRADGHPATVHGSSAGLLAQSADRSSRDESSAFAAPSPLRPSTLPAIHDRTTCSKCTRVSGTTSLAVKTWRRGVAMPEARQQHERPDPVFAGTHAVPGTRRACGPRIHSPWPEQVLSADEPLGSIVPLASITGLTRLRPRALARHRRSICPAFT